MEELETYTQANKDAWNASAEAHRHTKDWQEMIASIAAPGFSMLDDTLTQVLTEMDITGARAVQVGCNNGRELLSLPAFGAQAVLGIDQSDAFLAQAQELAALAGSDCAFLNANIYDLPDDVPRDFDVALITIGVLGWMPDLPRFFEVVAGLLTTGGRLVIYESHPILDMYEPDEADPFTPVRSYFNKRPQSWSETITYDGSAGAPGPESYWFTHTMGEIVTGCVASGLRIAQLTEYAHCNREVDFEKYEDRKSQLPLCYILLAGKT